MVDFSAFLQRKYDIQQQNADSERMRAEGASNFSNTQAAIAPAESRARVAGANALTAGREIENRFAPQTIQADIGYKNALARGTNASAASSEYDLSNALDPNTQFLNRVLAAIKAQSAGLVGMTDLKALLEMPPALPARPPATLGPAMTTYGSARRYTGPFDEER